jgi:N-acetylglucosaminyldiphosphoundecaprenol N-acetyl-beta-D-mannosaminyltransferase
MAGVDLTWQMLGELERASASVFLVGGSPAEVEGARSQIAARRPGLHIVGAHPGHFQLRGPESERVVESINSAAPDALLVAMGFPRQELWISENLPRLKVHVAIAEGGSFTFIAGSVPRAPRWMRRSGLEWLFRLLRQPWRVRRQLALPAFVWLVLRERLAQH